MTEGADSLAARAARRARATVRRAQEQVTGEPERRPRSASTRPERQPGEPLRICAITFCRDEGRMLPLWVKYYGAQLGLEHLYVVDDSSTDGSTDDLPCDVLRIPSIRGGAFNPVRMSMVSQLSHSLMQLYDVAMFVDTDEFIVPDPQHHDSLRAYVERRTDAGTEGPLDLDQPLLGQRRLAKFLPLMCKPAIKWVEAGWTTGTHGIRTPYEVDPQLWMFHMKFADRAHLQEAADHRKAMVDLDGRSASTQWAEGGDSLVALLDRITDGVDPAQCPVFRPPEGERLANLVTELPPGNFRAPRSDQKVLMERRPLVRIPERFHGLV